MALLGYTLVFGLSAALTVVAGGAWPSFEGAAWPTGPGALVGGLAVVMLLGPLSEEVGWRGFAQDPLAIGYLFTVLGYTVFFAWIHHRTGGSILAAVAAHFSINVTFAAAAPFDGSIIALATVLLAIAATVLAWRDPSLGGPRRATGAEAPE